MIATNSTPTEWAGLLLFVALFASYFAFSAHMRAEKRRVRLHELGRELEDLRDALREVLCDATDVDEDEDGDAAWDEVREFDDDELVEAIGGLVNGRSWR